MIRKLSTDTSQPAEGVWLSTKAKQEDVKERSAWTILVRIVSLIYMSLIFYPSKLAVYSRCVICISVIAISAIALFVGLHTTFWVIIILVAVAYVTGISHRSCDIDVLRGLQYNTILYNISLQPNQLSRITFDAGLSVSNPDPARGVEFMDAAYFPKVGFVGRAAVILRKALVGNRLSFYPTIWGVDTQRRIIAAIGEMLEKHDQQYQ